ncbi:uncharacterized protein LOC135226254 [Macrobrachium nipponense]|uniref:uncharacterized protein LOC135226254 n=1 Tax=Macrobrachium nipponense TaxID=159736 RepID=UPI0030C7B504
MSAQCSTILVNWSTLRYGIIDASFTKDASDVGVGAVPSQKDEQSIYHPVAYFSKKLTPSQRKYSTVLKEPRQGANYPHGGITVRTTAQRTEKKSGRQTLSIRLTPSNQPDEGTISFRVSCPGRAITASPTPKSEQAHLHLKLKQGDSSSPSVAVLAERILSDRRSGNILEVLLEILHLLGITDAEILEFVLEVMWVIPKVEEQLTFMDEMKLENASVDFMLTLTDPRARSFNKELGNLLIMKSVIYPYVPPNLQDVLDEAEKVLMVIWEVLGE